MRVPEVLLLGSALTRLEALAAAVLCLLVAVALALSD